MSSWGTEYCRSPCARHMAHSRCWLAVPVVRGWVLSGGGFASQMAGLGEGLASSPSSLWQRRGWERGLQSHVSSKMLEEWPSLLPRPTPLTTWVFVTFVCLSHPLASPKGVPSNPGLAASICPSLGSSVCERRCQKERRGYRRFRG